MSNIDEFIAYLIAGLVIIAAMLVAFNLNVFQGSQFTTTDIDHGENILNASPSDIPVGAVISEIYSPQQFNSVQASYLEETQATSLPDRRLVNGLLFGSNEMLVDVHGLSDVEEAYLSFFVNDTNKYGPLLIVVNNEVVSSMSFNIGQQSLYVPADKLSKLNGDVTISIKPASSGWMIWAPALYDIRNVQLVIRRLVSAPQVMSFALNNEQISSFSRGWITLAHRTAIGNITVSLNDNVLYYGTSLVQRVEYRPEYLKNDNTLKIVADKSSNFVGDISFILFYKPLRESTVTRSFMLSSSDYNDLARNPGKIQFRVITVTQSGGVNVKLNGDTLCQSSNCYPTVSAGQLLAFTFDKTTARTGNNTFTISAVDNSAFTIRELVVSR